MPCACNSLLCSFFPRKFPTETIRYFPTTTGTSFNMRDLPTPSGTWVEWLRCFCRRIRKTSWTPGQHLYIHIYIYISLQIVGLCISNCIVSTYVTYKWSNGIYMANPKPPDRDGDPWRTPLMWTGTWSHCRCCTVALGAATFIVDFPCLCKFHEEQMVKRTVKLCYYSI